MCDRSSEMTRFLVSSEAGEEMVAKANPLKRVGRTADIAGTALYLCSPAGAFTNGAIIALDGGQYLQSDVFGRRDE